MTGRAGKLEVLFASTAILCIAFFVSLDRFGRSGVRILGDGVGYYAWARSIVIDGDVDFSDELALQPLHGAPVARMPRTPLGLPVNKYPVGMAIVELPAVAFARAVEAALGIRSERPGYGPLYQWSVCLSLCLGGLAALYVAFRRLGERGDRFAVLLLAAGALGATNLPEYLTRSVSYPHLAGAALVALAWALGQRRRWSAGPALVIGLLAGLAVAVRNSNALVVPWLVAGFFTGPAAPRARDLAWMAAGAVLPLLAQLGANLALWGSLFVEPYPGERFDWLHPRLVDSLFSVRRGWLLWHPWFLVLLVLLAFTWPARGSRAERALHTTCLLAFVAHWLMNAAWWSWTFGFGFGNRAYFALLPVLTITVGRVRPRRGRALAAALVLALVLWNANLWIGFSVESSLRGSFDPSYVQCVTWMRWP